MTMQNGTNIFVSQQSQTEVAEKQEQNWIEKQSDR